jgi:hypothetical protein
MPARRLRHMMDVRGACGKCRKRGQRQRDGDDAERSGGCSDTPRVKAFSGKVDTGFP